MFIFGISVFEYIHGVFKSVNDDEHDVRYLKLILLFLDTAVNDDIFLIKQFS